MNGVIGEIRGFAGNFAPRTWAFCKGQLVSIAQNTALFSILGTTYGGDGRTTFALPDLRGRIPISEGRGPGLAPRPLGQRSGTEDVILNVLQIPSHFHFVDSTQFTANATPYYETIDADEDTPQGGDVPAALNYGSGITAQKVKGYGPASGTTVSGAHIPTVFGGSVSMSPTGSSQDHNNLSPYLVINWIICQQGIYPSRS